MDSSALVRSIRKGRSPVCARGIGGLAWLLLAVSLAVPAPSRAAEDALRRHDELGAAIILRGK
ncbi:MAG: hypothetical protein WCI75_08680, partial [candidate division NC10 bacterium]